MKHFHIFQWSGIKRFTIIQDGLYTYRRSNGNQTTTKIGGIHSIDISNVTFHLTLVF